MADDAVGLFGVVTSVDCSRTMHGLFGVVTRVDCPRKMLLDCLAW